MGLMIDVLLVQLPYNRLISFAGHYLNAMNMRDGESSSFPSATQPLNPNNPYSPDGKSLLIRRKPRKDGCASLQCNFGNEITLDPYVSLHNLHNCIIYGYLKL